MEESYQYLCNLGHSTTSILWVGRFNAVQHTSTRDDWIVDFHYPILTCFRKMISVSDPNPVLVEIILSVSESVLWCTTYILCCAYFALLGKITAGAILPLAEHNWSSHMISLECMSCIIDLDICNSSVPIHAWMMVVFVSGLESS